jgi:hypothetical protein
MKKKSKRILTIVALIAIPIIMALVFIANYLAKGVGDSVEKSIRGLYDISKKFDSTDLAKIDSLKKSLVIEFDSLKAFEREVFNEINCLDNGCEGVFVGPEFVNGSDVAHQFSNKMSGQVGDKLKALYEERKYSKVIFSEIKISTKGMGSGNVIYILEIPFEKVKEKCDAYTSFDHVGGWNHKPALAKRKSELKDVLMEGDKLNISDLKTTPEGLQEYWIQWRNKIKQSDCKP